MAGCGGVLRDHSGKFIFAFSHKLETSSFLEAELWAIYHGLSISWGKGFKQLIIASDCSAAINLLNSDLDHANPLASLVTSIVNITDTETEIRWRHIPRNYNIAANVLAMGSLRMNVTFYLWDLAPNFLILSLVKEAQCIGQVCP